MRKFKELIVLLFVILYASASAAIDGVCVKFCDTPSPQSGSSSAYTPSGAGSSRYTAPTLSPQQQAEIKAGELNRLGISQRKRGECHAAIESYTRALELNTSLSAKIRVNMGVAQDCLGYSAYTSGDYAAAVQWFEQALNNNPDDETIRYNYETAKEVYEQQLREQERARQERDARLVLENVLINTPVSLRNFSAGKPVSSTSLQFMDAAGPSREGYFDQVGGAAFSAGTSDTAPVPAEGVSKLAARIASLPVITPDLISGGKSPAGAARLDQPANYKPLLSGQTAQVRRQKARAVNALSMAQRMMEAGRLDTTRSYVEAALKADPDCTGCQRIMEALKESKAGANLEDPEERARLAMILGDDAYTIAVDHLPDARLFDSQGMLVTKAEFMLAALEFGDTWQDAVQFLDDARSLYPGNSEIISAIEEIKTIFTANGK